MNRIVSLAVILSALAIGSGCNGKDLDGVNSFSPSEILSKADVICIAKHVTTEVIDSFSYQSQLGDWEVLYSSLNRFTIQDLIQGVIEEDTLGILRIFMGEDNARFEYIQDSADATMLALAEIRNMEHLVKAASFPVYYEYDQNDHLEEHLGEGTVLHEAYSKFIDTLRNESSIRGILDEGDKIYYSFDDFNTSYLLASEEELFFFTDSGISSLSPNEYMTTIRGLAP